MREVSSPARHIKMVGLGWILCALFLCISLFSGSLLPYPLMSRKTVNISGFSVWHA